MGSVLAKTTGDMIEKQLEMETIHPTKYGAYLFWLISNYWSFKQRLPIRGANLSKGIYSQRVI